MDYKQIENFITELKSVTSCKIVTDLNHDIEEIHILADNSRSSKQISRDIQSILISKYNIDVDYKKISIAQVNENCQVDPDIRLNIDSVVFNSNCSNTIMKVSLCAFDKIYTGTAEGPKTEKNTSRLAVKATIKAIEEAFGFNNALLLEGIALKKVAERDIVTVVLTFINGGEESCLCGSAFVKTETIEAVVKATLSALNRKISIYKYKFV